MKFTVELDDFWLDEDENIESALSAHIVDDVVRKIKKSIEDKVDVQIKAKIDNLLKYSIEKHADKYMDACFKDAKIKTSVYDSEKRHSIEKHVSLEEYVLLQFKKDSGWSNPNEKITKLSKDFAIEFGKEIKERYDLMFASQIVSSIDKNGLLKDGVAKLLLENKE